MGSNSSGPQDGKWALPKRANRELARLLRSRMKELQCARPGRVRLTHVRAHARTPGNEAADQLAKAAVRSHAIWGRSAAALSIARVVHKNVHSGGVPRCAENRAVSETIQYGYSEDADTCRVLGQELGVG